MAEIHGAQAWPIFENGIESRPSVRNHSPSNQSEPKTQNWLMGASAPKNRRVAQAAIAGKKPKNFFHFLMDNECYATTGGQPVPNASEINYAGMAREAGYAKTFEFDDLEEFTNSIESIMKEEGPVFVAMKMIPKIENEPIGRRVRRPQRSRAEAIKAVQSELGITVV